MSKNVGDYVLTKKLGAGSFATVSLARHSVTGSLHAVKVISRDRLIGKHLENLESEIRILKNFRHENIVELFEIKKSERNIYLVLEYCEGGDLSKFIRAHGRLDEATSKAFMSHLAAGLKFLHEKNHIHRDLKPQNLLLSKAKGDPVFVNDGTLGYILKIADFGFARHLEVAMMAETCCGSPLYMAPEVLDGKKYDAKADLWSVGTILYEMVVGRPPYGGSSSRELLQNIKQRSLYVPDDVKISKHCLDVLKMLLKRQPPLRASTESFFNSEFIRSSQSHKLHDVADETSSTPVDAYHGSPLCSTSNRDIIEDKAKSSNHSADTVESKKENRAFPAVLKSLSSSGTVDNGRFADHNETHKSSHTKNISSLKGVVDSKQTNVLPPPEEESVMQPSTEPLGRCLKGEKKVLKNNFISKKQECEFVEPRSMQTTTFQPLLASPPGAQPQITVMGANIGTKNLDSASKELNRTIEGRSEANVLTGSDDFVLVESSKTGSDVKVNSVTNNASAGVHLKGRSYIGGLHDLDGFLKYMQLIEIHGRSAVLIAQLGDTNVVSALKSFQKAYIYGHIVNAGSVYSDLMNILISPDYSLYDRNEKLNFQRRTESHLDTASETKSMYDKSRIAMDVFVLSDDFPLQHYSDADEARLLAEALVLYLKSLGMIRNAITWIRSALDGIKNDVNVANDPPKISPQIEAAHQLISWAENINQWLAQQFSAVLDRSEQCNDKLKSSDCSRNEVASTSSSRRNNNDGSTRKQKTFSAEQLIFQRAIELAREGAVCEILGQFRSAQESLEKSALLMEVLLADGHYSWTSARSTTNFSSHSFDRQSLQSYLDKVVASAELLARKYHQPTSHSNSTAEKNQM